MKIAADTVVAVAGTLAAVAFAGTVAAVAVVGTEMELPPVSKIWANDHVLRNFEEGNGCSLVWVIVHDGGLNHPALGNGRDFGVGRPAPSSFLPCPFLDVLGVQTRGAS